VLDSGLKATLAASNFAPSAAVASGAGGAKLPARKLTGWEAVYKLETMVLRTFAAMPGRLLLAVHRSL